MSTSNLDASLREMLHERARDIDAFPARLAQLEHGDELALALPEPQAAGPRHHTRWLLAAAVAVIVALAGAIMGIRHLGDGTPPAAPNPTLSPTGSPSPPSPTSAPTSPVALACKATLPDAWKAAIGSTSSPEGAQSASPVQVLPDGDVLVARDFGQGRPRDLAIVSPGKAPRSVFSVPDPQLLGVQGARISGDWLVVSVGAHPRPKKGTVPGSSPMPNVVYLYVVDLRDGSRKQIASNPLSNGSRGDRTIDMATVLDGTVYWDVKARYTSRTGVIKAYDLTTGTTRTAYSGQLGYLVSGAAGIGANASTQMYVHASLPAPVEGSLSSRYPLSLATDGTAYAWEVAPREIAWWTPGQAAPRYLRLSKTLGQSDPAMLVVSGHYVLTAQSGQIIDMSTGAAATYDVPAKSAPILDSYGTTVVGADYVGEGHFQDGYWLDPQAQLVRFDTATLPDLRC